MEGETWTYSFKGYSFDLPVGLSLKPGYKEYSGDLVELAYVRNLLDPEEAAIQIRNVAEILSKSGVGGGNLQFRPVGTTLYVMSYRLGNWVSLNRMFVYYQLDCWLSRKQLSKSRYTMLNTKVFKFVPGQDKLFLSHGYIVDEAQALHASEEDGIPVGIRPVCILHDLSHDACTESEKQCKLNELTAQVTRGWAQMAALITQAGVVTVQPGGVVSESSDDFIHLSPVLPGCTIFLKEVGPQRLPGSLSLLCDAVEEGNLKLVRHCTAWLSTVNAWDTRGMLPLVVAARKGYVDIVIYLMEQGATVQMQDKKGVSPLLAATIEGHDNLVKLFQDAGATCNFEKAFLEAMGSCNLYVIKGLEAARGLYVPDTWFEILSGK